LQRTIEVRLADAVGADEHGQPADRKTNRAQRAVAGNADFANAHGHEPVRDE
jgi:hypothetical protein